MTRKQIVGLRLSVSYGAGGRFHDTLLRLIGGFMTVFYVPHDGLLRPIGNEMIEVFGFP
jgi:hypothetical protein